MNAVHPRLIVLFGPVLFGPAAGAVVAIPTGWRPFGRPRRPALPERAR